MSATESPARRKPSCACVRTSYVGAVSHAARLAAEDRPGPKQGAVAALLFLAAWLAALVGEAGAPVSAPVGAPTIGSATIVDSAPAPRFTARQAADSRVSRSDVRSGDPIGSGGTAVLPPALAELPLPAHPETLLPSLSSDPLAAHVASGFHARGPPRG